MKKNNKIILLAIILFIILVLVLGLLVISTKKEDNNKENITTKKIITTKKLGVNDPTAVNLFNDYNFMYDYLDMVKYDGNSYFDYFYKNDLVNSDNILESVKFMLAFNKIYGNLLDGLETIKDGKQRVDEEAIVMFNSPIDYTKIDSKRYSGKMLIGAVRGYSVMYDETNNLYIELAGLGGAVSYDYHTKIINVYKKDNSLIIENKVMFTYKVADEPLKVFKNANDIDAYYNKNDESNIIDEIVYNKEANIDSYINKLDTFRWTFTKNGSYYKLDEVLRVK